MKIVDLLSPDRIVVPVKGKTLRLAVAELVEAFEQSGAIVDVDRFEEVVAESLPSDVVTVGEAFLLHFRTDAVPRLTVGLGLSMKPMHREHDPSKTARIVLVVAAPPRDTSHFLRTVSAFSHALANPDVVDGLLEAKVPADVLQLTALADIELRGYLTVRDVMVYRRIAIRPDAPLGNAAQQMVLNRVPSLVVVSDTDEVLGLVGHRELLRHLLPLHVRRLTGADLTEDAARRDLPDPYEMPVREVMDRSVLCLSEDQTVAEVATMMLNRNIDRFPVVRDGALIGFLTRGDIVRRLFGR